MMRQLFGNSRAASRGLYSKWQSQSRRRAMISPAASISTPVGSILTFLSPCPKCSRSAVGFLNELFHLPQINTESKSRTIGTRDSLDELHFGSSSSSWDSVACACPTSGTILHFLSVSTDECKESRSAHPALPLIAVHGSHSSSLPLTHHLSQFSEEHYYGALMECRQRLARSIQERQISPSSALEARLRGLLVHAMCGVMGRHPNPSWILEKNPSTTGPISPLLDLTPLPSNAPSVKRDNKNISPNENKSLFKRHVNTGKLRELALPFFPGASSLQTKLSKSSLSRPLPGLYQCSVGPKQNESTKKSNATDNPGLIFRPLPAAKEDLRLSPPSLVFQCESLMEAKKLIEEKLGGRTFKIGWRGHGHLGSLIVSHPSILGLDIRICQAANKEWKPACGFDEAQESLLAGSMADLQSTHVVSEGKSDGVNASSVKEDSRTNNGDCWAEFRSNVRNPKGFFNQFTSYVLQKPARTMVASRQASSHSYE